MSVLDLGCGPAIAHGFVASRFASDIVMAEFSESNRKQLQKWLDGEKDTHDWSKVLDYIVTEIEGKNPDAIPERVGIFKHAVKAVVHCDVLQEPIISCGEYMKEYDVVQTFLCLETACSTRDQYKVAIERIMRSLLKPGGILVQYLIIQEESPSQVDYDLREYLVGDTTFYDLFITMDFALKCLKLAGFININTIPIVLNNINEIGSENYSTFLMIAFKPNSA